MNAIGEPILDWERSRALDLEDVPKVFESYAAEGYERTQTTVGVLPPRPLPRTATSTGFDPQAEPHSKQLSGSGPASSAAQPARASTDTGFGAEPHSDWAGGWERARAHQLMRLELVRDVPYTGYCDYLSNTIRMNADQTFTPERLKLLVLHEAYPGHDYHLWRREREFLIEEGCAAPYLGYRAVADASATWRGSRADFFTCLYGRMHSPRSLALAAELSREHT